MLLSYLDLTTTDPAFNLAVEEYVFDRLPKDRMYLLLWQNHNAIIVGKHQNTHAQINSAFVDSQNIKVVRRLSGGGAVYHDLGNLNFSVITDAPESGELDLHLFCLPVLRALQNLGVQGEVNGRNDMIVGGKKFSGNAQYIRNGRVMHHGTLLFDSNLTILEQALQVDPEKIRAKGIDSVRSRVTNLRPLFPQEVTLAQFRQALLESFSESLDAQPYTLTEEDLAEINKLKTARYATWQWNYGKSPACTIHKSRRIEGCGQVEAYLTVTHGKIESLQLCGDFFGDPEPLEQNLLNCAFARDALADALANIPQGCIRGLDHATFLSLLWD